MKLGIPYKEFILASTPPCPLIAQTKHIINIILISFDDLNKRQFYQNIDLFNDS